MCSIDNEIDGLLRCGYRASGDHQLSSPHAGFAAFGKVSGGAIKELVSSEPNGKAKQKEEIQMAAKPWQEARGLGCSSALEFLHVARLPHKQKDLNRSAQIMEDD